MAYSEQERENTVAMIHIGTWGSTTYPPTAWEGFAHAESSYAPEWISESELGCDRDDCVTVLDYSLGEPRIPDGYRIAYQFQAGEHECPDCRPDDEPEEYERQVKRSECTLCEQSGYIYSGEECVVLVLAPRYSYGSGMSGCLFDNGPHVATSVDDAIDSLLNTFGESITSDEESAMRANLQEHGIHRFQEPGDAGADYCSIEDMRGGE